MSNHHAGTHDGPNQNHNSGTTALSAAAETYAAHGVAIFPCAPHAKTPLTGHGFHDATTDPDQITEWWTAHPDANIGIPLGTNHIFALDVDGPNGRATLTALETAYTPLPDTYQVVTGREEGHGRHHIYRQPATGPPLRNRQLGDHLEIRGDGGYIIAPPSIHPSGRPYVAFGRWADITDPPDWLIALARQPAPQPAPPGPDGHGDAHALARLAGLAGRLALLTADSGQHVNDSLNHAAYNTGRLIAAGRLDRTHAEHVLTLAAQRAGLTPGETAATINSGITAGLADPDHDQPAYHVPDVTTINPPTSNGQHATALEDDPAFAKLVTYETARLLARDRARTTLTARQLEDHPPPAPIRLDTFLNQPDPPITYRIEQLWPADGRCLLAAQYKAGKTTTVGNVLASLADGDPLFATYPVALPTGRICLIDDELHPNTLRRWLRDLDIVHTGKIDVVTLRGNLTTFNILDETVRNTWAQRFADNDIEIVILDCLRPVIDALGLSEDKDVGKVLTAFDTLLETAGISEALIVHHMGHQGERSRGDSRLRDWPDAEWKLVRDQGEGEDDPAAPRYFSAIGRDVEEHEQRLQLVDGRRLEIVGGSRRAMKEWELLSAVIQVVIDQPGIAQRDICQLVTGKRDRILDVIKLAAREGYIDLGPSGATPRVPRVPPYPGNGGTPPVTPVENPPVPPVPHPRGTPRSPTPKGDRGNARGSDLWGTHDDTTQDTPR